LNWIPIFEIVIGAVSTFGGSRTSWRIRVTFSMAIVVHCSSPEHPPASLRAAIAGAPECRASNRNCKNTKQDDDGDDDQRQDEDCCLEINRIQGHIDSLNANRPDIHWRMP
jgi:hypothetical protein